jgi:hypothetical protein
VDDVFISYAREDESRIAMLVRALQARGLSVFWDRQIPPGRTWREHIGSALTQARCVVVAWSSHSIDSQFVAEEADDGKRRGVLLPVLLDAVMPPLGFRSLQAADLCDLRADALPAGFELLVSSIQSVLAPAGPQPSTPASAAQPVPRAVAHASQWRQPRVLLVATALLVGMALAYWLSMRSGRPAATAANAGPAVQQGAADVRGSQSTQVVLQIMQAWRTDVGGLAIVARITNHGAAPLVLTSATAFGLIRSGQVVEPPVESQPVFETLQRDEPVQFRLAFAQADGAIALRVTLPGLAAYQVEIPALR